MPFPRFNHQALLFMHKMLSLKYGLKVWGERRFVKLTLVLFLIQL